nr:hypothetical protein [Tanacetum cinerariifolium]
MVPLVKLVEFDSFDFDPFDESASLLNKDEKSRSEGIDVVVGMGVGVGVCVDICGIGMNGGIDRRMVDAAANEVLGITVTVSAGKGLSKF